MINFLLSLPIKILHSSFFIFFFFLFLNRSELSTLTSLSQLSLNFLSSLPAHPHAVNSCHRLTPPTHLAFFLPVGCDVVVVVVVRVDWRWWVVGFVNVDWVHRRRWVVVWLVCYGGSVWFVSGLLDSIRCLCGWV